MFDFLFPSLFLHCDQLDGNMDGMAPFVMPTEIMPFDPDAGSTQNLFYSDSDKISQHTSVLCNDNVVSTGVVIRARQQQITKPGYVKQGLAAKRIRLQTHFNTSAGPSILLYHGTNEQTSEKWEFSTQLISSGESRTSCEGRGHYSLLAESEVCIHYINLSFFMAVVHWKFSLWLLPLNRYNSLNILNEMVV